jgi:hypothetical protein
MITVRLPPPVLRQFLFEVRDLAVLLGELLLGQRKRRLLGPAGSAVRPVSIRRRSDRSDIATCCGRKRARFLGNRFPKLPNRTIKKRESKHIKKQDHAQRGTGLEN